MHKNEIQKYTKLTKFDFECKFFKKMQHFWVLVTYIGETKKIPRKRKGNLFGKRGEAMENQIKVRSFAEKSGKCKRIFGNR